ncbi:MAG TPA: hypothetical protein VHA74_02460 [Candidatus Dojkabacteria bacterium]|nr:hypothetical protein [Candidatus Dojkabacteria bacterium]
MSDHVAIMKKSWGLTRKILSGEKIIETRWYKNKVQAWNKVKVGDTVYFKDSGEPVTIKAVVSKVEQFDNLDEKKIADLFKRYGEEDLGTKEISEEIKKYVEGKKYSVIVWIKNPQLIEPFDIDKKGYGAMSAWLTVDNIEMIKK